MADKHSTWRSLVYNKSLDTKAVMKFYTTWSETYEADIASMGGNSLSKRVALWAEELVPEADRATLRVVDFAAGTGHVGRDIYEKGFRLMDAIDGSQPMLNKLQAHGVYLKTFCTLIGNGKQTEGITDNAYDLATMSGGFAQGHLPLDAFLEIIRVVKPGGLFIHGMTEHYIREVKALNNLEVYMTQLEEQGLWTRLRREIIPRAGANNHEGLFHAYKIN